jgi:coatomer protein complex subunit alpha (xenin)
MMHVKCQISKGKIKGLCFHPTRSWILASNYAGEIFIYDYRVNTLLCSFPGHTGCVRSVHFHPTSPLLVSGGHDCVIFGWNFLSKKKQFTLKGHFDFIRTVQFHHELPWVLSASDDHTIRIWNWQSRQSLVNLTGHCHYVMCAQFHPKEDYIVSGSLDMTIRLWDFAKLRERLTTGQVSTSGDFSVNDVEPIAKGDAHDRGVNWVAFHPTENLIVSSADDKKIKVWRYTSGTLYEKETFYGHTNNVSCVLVNAKTNTVVSNSEDKGIKVWDFNGMALDSYTKEGERQWILATHPNLPIIASGGDNSLLIISLDRSRIPYQTIGESVFYVKKNQFVMYDWSIKTEKVLLERIADNSGNNQILGRSTPKRILLNTYNNQKWVFMLKYVFAKGQDSKIMIVEVNRTDYKTTLKQTSLTDATFIGREKIGVVNKGNLLLSDSETFLSVGQLPNITGVDEVHMGGIGKIICRTKSKVSLYDTVAKKEIGKIDEFALSKLKFVTWNNTNAFCAMVAKKSIFIMDKTFRQISRVNEAHIITSAFWTKESVLIYTTDNHIKYVIKNGDQGIIQSIEKPYYIVGNKDDNLYALNADGEVEALEINRAHYLFKLAILQNDLAKVRDYISQKKDIGQGMIAYLHKKNIPAIAVSLAKDTRSRFLLAIESGNLEVAYEAAISLNDKKCFEKLAEEALRQGCHNIVEIGYQRSQNWGKLAN